MRAAIGLVLTALAVPTAAADYYDGACYDTSMEGYGCQWAQANGFYGCYLFAGVYTVPGVWLLGGNMVFVGECGGYAYVHVGSMEGEGMPGSGPVWHPNVIAILTEENE